MGWLIGKSVCGLVVGLAGFVYATDASAADTLAGWCFPPTACMSAQEPVTQQGFNTCEAFCRFSNPEKILSMDATVFDMVCAGDAGSHSERILVVMLKPLNDKTRALAITKSDVTELERCN